MSSDAPTLTDEQIRTLDAQGGADVPAASVDDDDDTTDSDSQDGTDASDGTDSTDSDSSDADDEPVQQGRAGTELRQFAADLTQSGLAPAIT